MIFVSGPVLKFGGLIGYNFRTLLKISDDRKSSKTKQSWKQCEAYYRQKSSQCCLTRHTVVRI